LIRLGASTATIIHIPTGWKTSSARGDVGSLASWQALSTLPTFVIIHPPELRFDGDCQKLLPNTIPCFRDVLISDPRERTAFTHTRYFTTNTTLPLGDNV